MDESATPLPDEEAIIKDRLYLLQNNDNLEDIDSLLDEL